MMRAARHRARLRGLERRGELSPGTVPIASRARAMDADEWLGIDYRDIAYDLRIELIALTDLVNAMARDWQLGRKQRRRGQALGYARAAERRRSARESTREKIAGLEVALADQPERERARLISERLGIPIRTVRHWRDKLRGQAAT